MHGSAVIRGIERPAEQGGPSTLAVTLRLSPSRTNVRSV
jgi:hypothetical protein